MLNIALPKGRLGSEVYRLFADIGCFCRGMEEQGRKLVFEDEQTGMRYLLVKPSDVAIYVERGAADIGVVGKDVLLETEADVYELLDLKLGACRLVAAAREDWTEDSSLPLRVATTYPNVAAKFFSSLNRQIEIIKLNGSVELAPILGLSDVIVDIVETGRTLAENRLRVWMEIEPSTARLIANKSSYRFETELIDGICRKLGERIQVKQ